MTSNRSIYVGLDLASDQEVTAAGLVKLERRGIMEFGEFAYGKRYLASPRAFALNPDYLLLKDAAMTITGQRLRDGGALPLTFRDVLPDSWGMRVLQAQHGRALSDVDCLLLSNSDRIGAMVFSETLPILGVDSGVNLVPLEALAEAVRSLELSMEITPKMRRLLQGGGTLGGARPKASFIHENKRWLAKFPAQGDDHDVQLLEMSLLDVARKCGIEVSPAKLEKIHRGNALLLLRFDREGFVGNERRIHYLSASALLNIPYESNGGSYLELAQILRRISSNPTRDLEQLFRRMILNLVIDNTDDHVKNHGVLYVGDGQYRLSPAFDVVMQLTNLGYQELAIDPGNHESKIALAIKIAPSFGIHEQAASEVIESIHSMVKNELIPIVRKYGGDERLIERVNACLERQHKIVF